MKRLHRKSKLHFSILREITHSRWVGYKSVLLELSERPFFDVSALRMSVELFDIYLLDNLVHIYNSYFLSNMDIEVIYNESSSLDLDVFFDRAEQSNYWADLFVSYRFKQDEHEILLEYEFDEQGYDLFYYYRLFFGGPLELVYHNLILVTWTNYGLMRLRWIKDSIFVFINSVIGTFPNFHLLERVILFRENEIYLYSQSLRNVVYNRYRTGLNVIFNHNFTSFDYIWKSYALKGFEVLLAIVKFTLSLVLIYTQYFFKLSLYFFTSRTLQVYALSKLLFLYIFGYFYYDLRRFYMLFLLYMKRFFKLIVKYYWKFNAIKFGYFISKSDVSFNNQQSQNNWWANIIVVSKFGGFKYVGLLTDLNWLHKFSVYSWFVEDIIFILFGHPYWWQPEEIFTVRLLDTKLLVYRTFSSVFGELTREAAFSFKFILVDISLKWFLTSTNSLLFRDVFAVYTEDVLFEAMWLHKFISAKSFKLVLRLF